MRPLTHQLADCDQVENHIGAMICGRFDPA
jgi:hypothetical protein